MFEPLKVIYINRDEIIEEFLEKNPEYKGKELTLNVYSNSYNIKYRKKLLHLVQALDGYVFKEAGRVYGYARISRPQQSIDRQIRNIKAEYPSAIILQEAFTGTKMDRPEWKKMYKKAIIGG